MKKLDLGCGTAKVKGALGVDVVNLEGVDVLANLSSLPLPFADNTFDEIYLNDVIEHLPNTISTMEELYRISRPGSKVYIRVVNWNSHYTAMDPTHLHAFTENSFDFFGKRKGRSYYSVARFDVVRVGYQYNHLAERLIRYRPLLKILSFYLNNILEGLSFELHTVKDQAQSTEIEEWERFFSILRCPYCLGKKLGIDSGKLVNINNQWLVCREETCNRKYPIIDNTPIMLLAEGERWVNIQEEFLPPPPQKDYPRISTDAPSGEEDLSRLYRCEKYEDMDFETWTVWVLNWFRKARWFFLIFVGLVLSGLLILFLQKLIAR